MSVPSQNLLFSPKSDNNMHKNILNQICNSNLISNIYNVLGKSKVVRNMQWFDRGSWLSDSEFPK